MDLCGGCFTLQGVRSPVTMKARHFARRFSLQPALSRGNSAESRDGSGHSGAHHSAGAHQGVHPGTSGLGAIGGARRGTTIPFITTPATNKEDNVSKKYRVVVMGSGKVGKTAIINQFLYDCFTPKYTKTVEEMHHGEYEVSGMCLTLEILDTSGSFEFPAMRALSINSADAFVLVYSITDADSFEEVRSLRQLILESKEPNVPIVVVGNKNDLDDQRAVPLEFAESIVVIDWENGFLEASAKDNLHVLHIFKELLNQAKIKYALSPAVKRRRQSMPNVGMQITSSQLHHLHHLKKSGAKRNSCVIS